MLISESAVECAINALAISEIGTITLTQEKLNAISDLVSPDLMNTNSMKKHISLAQKIGGNKGLWTQLTFKDITVKFDSQQSNVVVLEYTACIAVEELHRAGGGEEEIALYDEIRFMTELTLAVKDDKVLMQVLQHKLDTSLSQTSSKTGPVRTRLDITQREYREFLSNVGYAMNEMKKWINKEVLSGGIDFPYKMD